MKVIKGWAAPIHHQETASVPLINRVLSHPTGWEIIVIIRDPGPRNRWFGGLVHFSKRDD